MPERFPVRQILVRVAGEARAALALLELQLRVEMAARLKHRVLQDQRFITLAVVAERCKAQMPSDWAAAHQLLHKRAAEEMERDLP